MPERDAPPDHGLTVLTRRLPGTPDPLGVFSLADKTPRTLFETADAGAREQAENLIFLDACVSLVAREGEVRMRPHDSLGKFVAPCVARQVEAAQIPGNVDANGEVRFRFAPSEAGDDEQTRLREPSVLDPLRALTFGLDLPKADGAAQGFVFGCFGYDLLASFESLAPVTDEGTGFPDYSFHLAGSVIRIDHRHARTTISVLAKTGDAVVARRRLTALAAMCRQAEPVGTVQAAPVNARVTQSDTRYGEVVQWAKQHIAAGEACQIVPSRAWEAPCPDPLAAYARLRKTNPSPYMFYLDDPAGTLFGASPESALKVDAATRRVEIRPIAGTRPRGVDAESDTRLELELRLSEKEVAEHVMLVDLARNDVAHVSTPGSRRVSELMQVERYSRVMHLVSRVEGTLAPGLDALHAYRATLNMGTLTGAPKLRAADILRRCEPGRRGAYGGAVGYLTAAGDLDTAIVIRSALVRGGMAHVRAGAGVVADSEPSAEAEETRRKAQAVLDVLGAREEEDDD